MMMRLALTAAVVHLCAACAVVRWSTPAPSAAPVPVEKITMVQTHVPRRGQLPGVVGRMQSHRIKTKETLLDVARDAGLGFNEVKDANRSVDEWIPPVGLEVAVPTQWIVPRSGYRGLVVNIPEMRLYLFPSKTKAGEVVTVRTWAIGIGTEETPSPIGAFRVTAKDKNPTWYVPDSIYRTMDPPKRRVVGPGPDNPLGAYRLRLSKGLYSIHGTDIAWSIGRLTTHGCIRLYPEDIGDLFTTVTLGTSGEFIYQPIKLGESGGQIYIEVHDDIYRRIRNLEREALKLAREAGLKDRIDHELLRQAVREKRGIPVRVTRRETAPVTAYRPETRGE
jgi:L,D-transpeptidase ErfK/SrfK